MFLGYLYILGLPESKSSLGSTAAVCTGTLSVPVLGTMIFCDKSFGADGLSFVPVGDGRWIAITVAVKSSASTGSINRRGSASESTAEAVGVPSVVENCGAASLCNGYRCPPKTQRSHVGASSTTPGQGAAEVTIGTSSAPAYDANALPVKFDHGVRVAVHAKGLKAVRRLVDSKRLAGFLRVQVVVPRAGKRSAFKRVPVADGTSM